MEWLLMFWTIWVFVSMPSVGMYVDSGVNGNEISKSDWIFAYSALILGPLIYLYIYYLKRKKKYK